MDLSQYYKKEEIINIKNLINMDLKINKLKNQKTFLTICKKKQLEPKFLDLKLARFKFYDNNIQGKFINNVSRFKFNIINLLLTDNTKTTLKLTKQILILRQKLIDNSNPYFQLIKTYYKQQECRTHKQFYLTKNRHIKKIKLLIKDRDKQLNKLIVMNDKCKHEYVENISNTQIPNNIINTLKLGPNYAIPYSKNKLPTDEIIANIEEAIDILPDEHKIDIRTKITNTIYNYKNKNNKLKVLQWEHLFLPALHN